MSRKGAVFKMAPSQGANLMGFTAQPTQKNKSQGGHSRVQAGSMVFVLKTTQKLIFSPVRRKSGSDFPHSFKVAKIFKTLRGIFQVIFLFGYPFFQT